MLKSPFSIYNIQMNYTVFRLFTNGAAAMKNIEFKPILLLAAVTLIITACSAYQDQNSLSGAQTSTTASEWQEEFDIENCSLKTEGSRDFFILEPGFQLVLEGGSEKLPVTVLDETVEIDGVQTRVVEEREWRNGEIIEVSLNFFAY